MSDGWYDEAIIDPGNGAGDYTDNGEPKGLLHTTEGKTYAGAKGAYITNNSWPHATCTYEDGVFRIYQHNSILKAARALKNLSGGTQTNTDRVAQLEIVGTADLAKRDWGDQYVENFPQAYLDGIARWMRWVEQTLGVPRVCTVTFKQYPYSYGPNNGVRLSAHDFDNYSGWLGHMHAAENTHGDPGLIDIDYLLGDVPIDIPTLEDLMPFPVIREGAGNAQRPNTALLPGMVIKYNAQPVPLNDVREIWAPATEYHAGVKAGLLKSVTPLEAGDYDAAVAAAKRMELFTGKIPVD